MTTTQRLSLMAVALAASLGASHTAARAQVVGPSGLDRSRPIGYFIGPGTAAAGSRVGDNALAVSALEAWASLADPPILIEPASEADAVLRIYWMPAGAGLYGEMRARSVGGRPAADVFVHPDIDVLGPDLARRSRSDPLFRDTIVYLTCVHELGHAFGLGHTSAFADIMYSFQYGGDIVAYFGRFRQQLSSRDDVRTTSPFSVADLEAFRRIYVSSRLGVRPRSSGR